MPTQLKYEKNVATKMWFLASCMITGWPTVLWCRRMELCGNLIIEGKEHIDSLKAQGQFRKILFASNHESMLDAFYIGYAACTPEGLEDPFVFFPWQVPDKTNFLWWMPWMYGGPFVLIERDKNGQRTSPAAYRTMLEVLDHDKLMVLFPEGTRSERAVREGKELLCHTVSGMPIAKPKEGVGGLVLKARPTIVPVLIKGAKKVQPIGTWIPRYSRGPITIRFGKPQTSSDILASVTAEKIERHKLRQQVADAVMYQVASLDN